MNILIIAGEASSDMHAANLVRNIKSLTKEASFVGLGGEKMETAGVNILHNIVRFAFIGPGGLFQNYLRLRRLYSSLCRYIDKNRPDCAILIDYAEFNLEVAKYLKRKGVPIIYYISPQVWAWGAWRIKTIKRLVNKMLVLFKFEEELYKKHAVDATFVGHPLLDIVKQNEAKDQIIKKLNLTENAVVIGVLPGSRDAEIKKILPIMLESCSLILKKSSGMNIEFVLPVAPTVEESLIKSIVDKQRPLNIKIIKNYTYNTLSVCDCAMVASGTATLETALMGVPMAIIYKVNFLTYIVTRSVIRLPYIGLVNVIAGEKIVPEFLQYEADPERISEYTVGVLNDKKMADSIRKRLFEIRKSLGESGASRRAAQEVVKFISNVS